jgi:8-oxo-dGTP pyrophosphatase MutT (NUDIX family)
MHFSDLFEYCPRCGSAAFEPHKEKAMKCRDCGFVYYINPSAATAAFIRNVKGDLLVCVRAKDPAKGTLDLPGGFVDAEETAEDAIVREVNEEIGTRPLSARYLFSIPNVYVYSGLSIPTLDLFFECVIDGNVGLKAADDVADCFYLPTEHVDAEMFGLMSVKSAVVRYLKDNK